MLPFYKHLAVALILSSPLSMAAPEKLKDPEFKKSYDVGRNYYGYCMFCHAKNGKGTKFEHGGTMAPPLAGSPRVLASKDVSIRIVLHGLTGKVDGVVYEKNEVAMMPPPESMVKDDRIVAGLLNYVRNAWGNEAPVITEADIRKVRELEADRKTQWTIEELMKKFPQVVKEEEEEPAE